MEAWSYYTEWWHVPTGKDSHPVVPPRAAELGAQGWEMVSVVCFPITGYENIKWDRASDGVTRWRSATYTTGAWFQAFYKRPAEAGGSPPPPRPAPPTAPPPPPPPT